MDHEETDNPTGFLPRIAIPCLDIPDIRNISDGVSFVEVTLVTERLGYPEPVFSTPELWNTLVNDIVHEPEIYAKRLAHVFLDYIGSTDPNVFGLTEIPVPPFYVNGELRSLTVAAMQVRDVKGNVGLLMGRVEDFRDERWR